MPATKEGSGKAKQQVVLTGTSTGRRLQDLLSSYCVRTLRQHCANTPSGLLLAQCANTTLRPTVGTPLWSQVRQHRANVKIRTLRDGWMARGRSGWLGVWRNGRDGSGKVRYVQCSYVTVRKLMSRTLPDLTARDDWTAFVRFAMFSALCIQKVV